MVKEPFRFIKGSAGRCCIITALAVLFPCVCGGQTTGHTAAVTNTLARINSIRAAIVDYYIKYQYLPPFTTNLEPTLMREEFLQEPLSSNIWTRVLRALPASTPVTATNYAYSLDGNLTNNVLGSIVAEAVVVNVTGTEAREMSLLTDGERLSSPIGEADAKGRVKYDAIPPTRSGEVHVYLMYSL